MNRLKCVSKRWLSLISHPSFVHYQSLHPNPTWTFLKNVVEEGSAGHETSNYLDLVDHNHNITTPISKVSVVPFKRLLRGSRVTLVASSNGLLLCKELCLLTGVGRSGHALKDYDKGE